MRKLLFALLCCWSAVSVYAVSVGSGDTLRLHFGHIEPLPTTPPIRRTPPASFYIVVENNIVCVLSSLGCCSVELLYANSKELAYSQDLTGAETGIVIPADLYGDFIIRFVTPTYLYWGE